MTNTSVRDLVDRALLPLRAVDGALHDRAVDYVVDGARRLRAEESARGALIPDGLGADAKAELAWRKAAIAAVGRGASRAEAEALAWRTIGRRPPAVTAGRDVLGGLTGPDRAREVLRRLKTPTGEAATAPGTGQNRPTLRRHREGSERPANRLPRNPGSERSAA